MKSLLLVDDEPIISVELQRTLELFGYRVETAHSFESAFEWCSKAPFDAILVEFNLRSERRTHPRAGKGIDLVRQMRAFNAAVLILMLPPSTLAPTTSSRRPEVFPVSFRVFGLTSNGTTISIRRFLKIAVTNEAELPVSDMYNCLSREPLELDIETRSWPFFPGFVSHRLDFDPSRGLDFRKRNITALSFRELDNGKTP